MSKHKMPKPGSQQQMVGRAISRYVAASRKWNADCNLRPMKTPDAKQRRLADESRKAFDALVGVIKQGTSNTKGSRPDAAANT